MESDAARQQNKHANGLFLQFSLFACENKQKTKLQFLKVSRKFAEETKGKKYFIQNKAKKNSEVLFHQ